MQFYITCKTMAHLNKRVRTLRRRLPNACLKFSWRGLQILKTAIDFLQGVPYCLACFFTDVVSLGQCRPQ